MGIERWVSGIMPPDDPCCAAASAVQGTGGMDAIGLVVRMPSQEALATAAAIQLACVIADVLVWH